MNLKSMVMVGLMSAAVQSFAFSRVVLFGDSLSDTGNVFALTGGATPPAPYWNGRYSNGPVWAERLASGLGLSANASLTGGTNFAFGGAEANTGSTLSHNGTPNVGAQIGQFTAGGGSLTSTDLVSLWIGGNDFLNGATNPSTVAGYVGTHLNTLYGLGGRTFLIPNLPLLGYTPGYVGTAMEAPVNALTAGYNTALSATVANFRATHSGVTVRELDVATLFNTVRTDPSAYGLTDVTHNYLTTGGNPDQFLFWDNVHPTQQIHMLVGNAALQAVPEPTSMVALGLGGLALMKRRRK